jgi:hypothetical protein
MLTGQVGDRVKGRIVQPDGRTHRLASVANGILSPGRRQHFVDAVTR